jgi:transcriptional regulator of arginine metabolism
MYHMRKFMQLVEAMPTATAQQQHERRQAIARILREHRVSRQSELVELLRAAGFLATQSSVSRDLKDLGAAKLKEGYTLPETADGDGGDSMFTVAELVRDIRAAGPNLLVITTAVGAAQRVAVTLDRTNWPEIVGTLSGDDTIFIATSSSTQQRRLRGRLRQSLKKAPI